jgi:hypothetical protein
MGRAIKKAIEHRASIIEIRWPTAAAEMSDLGYYRGSWLKTRALRSRLSIGYIATDLGYWRYCR